MHSSLTSTVVQASPSNYTKGRNGYKICKFTPHHMAGKLTGAQCARLFQNSGRGASSNYCIGYDGEIVCSVEEEDRAWTSSSRTNDFQAITVEVANSTGAPEWKVSDAAWNSLVKLAVDVCKRYNFRLTYDGTPNGSLTRHNMFANTSCPGPYLQGRFPELVKTVNAILDGQSTDNGGQEQPIEPSQGYLVTVTADVLNVRKGPGTNYGIATTVRKGQVYTIVATQGSWGKLKSGAGWIHLRYTKSGTNTPQPVKPTPAPSTKFVLGRYKVNAKSGLNVRKGPGTNYGIIKTYKNGTVFDTYQISGDWAKTPSGWVNLKYATLMYKY